MSIDKQRISIGSTLRQTLTLLLSYLPAWLVASALYRAIAQRFSVSPDAADFSRDAAKQLGLVVNGFPGSGVTFFANALHRSAPVRSRGNSVPFLKRALRSGSDVVVLVRHPIDACSYAKNRAADRIPDRLWLLNWIRYYSFVRRSRVRPVLVDFAQFAFNGNPLTTAPALADLLSRRGWRYEPEVASASREGRHLGMIQCAGTIDQHLLLRAMELYRDLIAEARGEQPQQRTPRISISPLADRLLDGYSGAVALLFPIIAVWLAAMAKVSLRDILPGGMFAGFMAVIVASALLGVIPGIIATALSGASAAYALNPADSFRVASPGDQASLFCFILISLFCTAIITMTIRRAFLPSRHYPRSRSWL